VRKKLGKENDLLTLGERVIPPFSAHDQITSQRQERKVREKTKNGGGKEKKIFM